MTQTQPQRRVFQNLWTKTEPKIANPVPTPIAPIAAPESKLDLVEQSDFPLLPTKRVHNFSNLAVKPVNYERDSLASYIMEVNTSIRMRCNKCYDPSDLAINRFVSNYKANSEKFKIFVDMLLQNFTKIDAAYKNKNYLGVKSNLQGQIENIMYSYFVFGLKTSSGPGIDDFYDNVMFAEVGKKKERPYERARIKFGNIDGTINTFWEVEKHDFETEIEIRSPNGIKIVDNFTIESNIHLYLLNLPKILQDIDNVQMVIVNNEYKRDSNLQAKLNIEANIIDFRKQILENNKAIQEETAKAKPSTEIMSGLQDKLVQNRTKLQNYENTRQQLAREEANIIAAISTCKKLLSQHFIIFNNQLYFDYFCSENWCPQIDSNL